MTGSGLSEKEHPMRLLRLGEPAIEPLIAALNDESKLSRFWAVKALGKSGQSRVIEPLSLALNDNDLDVRTCITGCP